MAAKSLPLTTSTQLHNILARPHLEYCPTALDPAAATLSNKLEIENRTMRCIPWPNDKVRTPFGRTQLRIAKLTYQILSCNTPSNLANTVIENRDVGRQSGRNVDKLHIPNPQANWLKHSFRYKLPLYRIPFSNLSEMLQPSIALLLDIKMTCGPANAHLTHNSYTTYFIFKYIAHLLYCINHLLSSILFLSLPV